MEPSEAWARRGVALHNIKQGMLVSIDPEATYNRCRGIQKERGNYNNCDVCQFRFKCWTADRPVAEVTGFGERDKKYMRTSIRIDELTKAIDDAGVGMIGMEKAQKAIVKAMEVLQIKEISNLYGLREGN